MDENLSGNWKLQRVIYSTNQTILSQMQGVASFFPVEKNVFKYEENIRHSYKENVFLATQAYHYHFLDDSLKIIMQDGRTLANFDLQNLKEFSSQFQCNKDVYETSILFWEKDIIQTKIKVSGPKKNYQILTTLKKKPKVY